MHRLSCTHSVHPEPDTVFLLTIKAISMISKYLFELQVTNALLWNCVRLQPLCTAQGERRNLIEHSPIPHIYNLHQRILNNLWHFWQVRNVSKFETVCHRSTGSLFLFYLLMLFICLSKITSLLLSCSLTPRVTRRALATTQVGESTEKEMEAE